MQAAMILLLFRHLHFFVIVNELPQPPQIHLQTRQYYTYTDPLRVSAYDETGQQLLQTSIAVGSALERSLPMPAKPFYLIEADPGMNGATFECSQPWGVMGSANNRMGVNGPGPQLYFYVPPDCAEFLLGAQSVSPNEGGRLVIKSPDGKERALLDGELNAETQAKVTVPPDLRDNIWSLQWSKPETCPAALDDLNFWLDGKLTPLLFPKQEWAEKHGKKLWERDVAGRAGEE